MGSINITALKEMEVSFSRPVAGLAREVAAGCENSASADRAVQALQLELLSNEGASQLSCMFVE